MGYAVVEVAIPVPGRCVFSYRLPEALRDRAVPGSRVLVPFRRSRTVGFVVSAPETELLPTAALENVIEMPDESPVLSGELLELTRWAASYYLCSWGEMLRSAVPGGSALRRRVRVKRTPAGLAEAESLLPGADDARSRLLKRLAKAPPAGLERASLVARAGRGGSGVLARLVASGLAELAPEDPQAVTLLGTGKARALASSDLSLGDSTAPGDGNDTNRSTPPDLTGEQGAAVEAILATLDEPIPAPFLLHGVTGSGKTEVYLAAIAEVLRRGRSAIYLVPEIGLTPMLHERIRERFGDRVAALHSGLTPAERRREWGRIQRAEATVVLGPRSAVFAPVAHLGVIVVDEEQDPAYKQQDTPRYHGRDVALVRARMAGAVAILGTATPSLESWRNARTGKYRHLRLTRRVAGRALPSIELVDMREEFRRTGEPAVLSERLLAALSARRERGEQAVILINRRGWAPFLLCRSCGRTVECRHCAVSMALHATDDSLRCHWCGQRRRRPVLCPGCRSEHLQPMGAGTQQVERDLRHHLPNARIARMDSDTVRGRSAHRRILESFDRQELDVLVGTQMVAKGHDFPNVTLVGVLLTDAVLGMPDFRAAERTYQLLTQVAGRSGRGDLPGEVIVQTCRSDHYAVSTAARGDEDAFYDREMAARRALRFPPFQVMAQIIARGSRAEKAEESARRAAKALVRLGGGRVQVLGPAPAPIARLKGRFRYQVIARAVARRRLGAALQGLMAEAESEGFGRDLVIDVDPVALL